MTVAAAGDLVGPTAEYSPGSRQDFDRLYTASYARVVRTLVGIVGSVQEAEDCAQETFYKAFRAWPRWRADVPAEVWIHRIAINTAISQVRKQKVRDFTRLVQRLGRALDPPDPHDRAEVAQLVAALRRLQPHEAAAVVLRHYHGYTNREIATALGVSERTVGSRLASAISKLRLDPDLSGD